MNILYSFRRCPWAMRARMALVYAGIACELREVDLKNKPAHMLEVSPKGTVPVLLFPDGTVIDESLDVMKWALAQSDPDGWAHPGAAELITKNDTEFAPANHRYKYTDRFPDEDPAENKARAEQYIAELEQRLQDQAFLLGEGVSLADVALFPLVRQFSKIEADWFATAPYPKLRDWLAYFNAAPYYQTAMIKNDPWQEGDDPVSLLQAAA